LDETLRESHPARARPSGRAVSTLLVLVLAGCVDFDLTLKEDGSGTFTLQSTAPNARFDLPGFFSPHVKVLSVNRTGVAISLQGTFDDVTKLSTAEMFRRFTIRRTHLGGQERLRVLYRNPALVQVPPEQRGVWVVNIGVDLPAPVRFANRGGVRTGARVVWHVPLADFQEKRLLKLGLRYGSGNVEPAPAGNARPKRHGAAVLGHARIV